MNVNVRNGLICMATGLLCAASGYIAGHAACAHQHVSSVEKEKMARNKDGKLSYRKYIVEAFKDYKKVQDDPLGLNVRPL